MAKSDDVIAVWGDWTGDVVTQRHECLENPNSEVGILRREASESGPAGWILANVDIATEVDVRRGMAAAVGDLARATSILISVCPFCGLRLDG
jgi:hypothetical protein